MEDSENRNTGLLFSVHAVNHETQNEIRKSIHMLLKSRGYGELLMPVFTCINELLVNAVKANFKNLYFEDYMPKNKNKRVLPYRQTLELFRHEIKNNGAEHLEKLSRERNIRAELQITITDDNLLEAVITNPYPMTEIEEYNVIRRRDVIGKINDLADYFAINEKESLYEGAGLGLIFIGMILKSLALPPSQLDIRSDGSVTRSSLTIPLNREVLESYRKIAHVSLSE